MAQELVMRQSIRNSVMGEYHGDNEPVQVFSAADCEAQLAQLAQVNCPLLANLWSSMGISDSQVYLLMFELYSHVDQLFSQTIKETEEQFIQLEQSIETCSREIPLLASEINDQSAMSELTAIMEAADPSQGQPHPQYGVMGLRQKSLAITALQKRLKEIKDAAKQYIEEGMKELMKLSRELDNQSNNQLHDLSMNQNDFSLAKCDRIRTELERLQSIKQSKIESINQSARAALELCAELDVIPDDFTNCCARPDFNLDDPAIKQPNSQPNNLVLPVVTYHALMHSLSSRVDRLNSLKQQNVIQANKLLDQIHHLWIRLNIEPNHQQSFLSSVTSSVSNSTLKKMERELADLEAMKQSKMAELINQVRNQIEVLWQKLGYSHEQSNQFRPFFQSNIQSNNPSINQSYNDDKLLEEHEHELDRLKRQYDEYAPILKLVNKRDEYRHTLADHELNSSNSDRLVTRKPNFQVLKEEERIRTIEKKWLPKCENDLIEQLQLWEKHHGMDFMWNGQRLVDIIKMEIEEGKQIVLAKKRAAEEARGKNAERNSVYGRKPEGVRTGTQPSNPPPFSAGKSRPITTPTPSRTQTKPNQTVNRSLNQSICQSPSSQYSSLNTSISSNASTMSMYARPQGPLFDSRIPNLPSNNFRSNLYAGQSFNHQSINQSPVRPISRTTPCKMTPSRLPTRQANKENSSL